MDHMRILTVAEFQEQPNVDDLLDRYAEECSIPELGFHFVRFDLYEAMERVGALRVIGGFRDEEMVGFLVLIVTVVPHYGAMIGTTESFFLTPEARSGGLGKKMLGEAERVAKEAGAVAMFVSAPVGSRLEKIMPRRGYRQTNAVFLRAFE